MESSNSGSLQSSSSGADKEDFSSHVESFSANFLNFPPPFMTSHLHCSPTSVTTSFSHPLSPFFAHVPPLPPPPPPGPDTLRLVSRSSSSPSHHDCTIADVSATSAGSISSTLSPVQRSDHAAADPQGSKKRPRASRRAPTTVLTTDPSNFRAMVQQFTGSPAPPFHPSSTTSTSSAYSRPRLNLFGHLGASASPPANYNLLGPFAQKFQPPPMPLIGSSSSSSIARSGLGHHLNLPLNAAGSTSSSSSSFHALSPSRNLQLPPSDLRNQNPMHAQNEITDSGTPRSPNSRHPPHKRYVVDVDPAITGSSTARAFRCSPRDGAWHEVDPSN